MQRGKIISIRTQSLQKQSKLKARLSNSIKHSLTSRFLPGRFLGWLKYCCGFGEGDPSTASSSGSLFGSFVSE